LRSDYVPSRNVTLVGTGGRPADNADQATAPTDGA